MSRGPSTATLTVATEQGQDWARFPSVTVRLSTGGAPGQSVQIQLEPVDVGSSPECDLVCKDPKVSRKHCQVTLAEEGLWVEDLDSKNGTFINGVRISRALLGAGQSVTLGNSRLEIETKPELTQLPLYNAPRFGLAEGSSVRMRKVFSELDRAAASDATLLLWGETGTGKELMARAVHEHSKRSEAPFVIFDCGAVSEMLLESELFGHEKGAFTGAETAHEGLVEAANTGTLFLDEIGELPLDAQSRLLRLLEKRTYRRVGGSSERQVDVRIIAATHRDLRSRVTAKAFREDLFFRLAVLEVTLPPLRQRMDDLPRLVELFLSELSPPRALKDLPPGHLEMFSRHNWPGNIRELRNAVQRAILFPEQSTPTFADITSSAPNPFFHFPLRQAREAAMNDFERRYLVESLSKHQGNVAETAEAMGVSRQLVYRMITKHGLRLE